MESQVYFTLYAESKKTDAIFRIAELLNVGLNIFAVYMDVSVWSKKTVCTNAYLL